MSAASTMATPARVRLGKSELQVSPICYGTWQLSPQFWGPSDEAEHIRTIRRAFEIGVNFYDSANAYGDGLAETVLGRAVRKLPRDQVIIATKCFWVWHADGTRYFDLSKDGILRQCEESLQRLQLDYIDLYQCHSWDPLTDMRETVAALELLVQHGKIRAYGVSNWTPEQMRLGQAVGGKFATCQPIYSLLHRDLEADVLPYCQANDMGVLVFSPLHKGLLTGKYKGAESFNDARKGRADFSGERFQKICQQVAKLEPIARRHNLSTVQLVLTATLMHPSITCAIAGIKNTAQIEDAAGAMGKAISRADWCEVRSLLTVR